MDVNTIETMEQALQVILEDAKHNGLSPKAVVMIWGAAVHQQVAFSNNAVAYGIIQNDRKEKTAQLEQPTEWESTA